MGCTFRSMHLGHIFLLGLAKKFSSLSHPPPSRFLCCVLSYFSLVFVMEHLCSRWYACSPYRGWTLKWRAACSLLWGWDFWPAETTVFSRFFYFFGRNFFLQAAHLYGQTVYILQKNCLQMSFPGCREAPNILLPFKKGPHRLLNWQIQVIRVSWVGQSTSVGGGGVRGDIDKLL